MKRLLIALALCGLIAASVGAQDKEEERADRPSHDLLGLDTHPYVAIAFDRTSGDDAQWTAGVTGGVEVDFDPFWIGLGYTLHDILTEDQVVPWDGTAFAKLGLYQGGIGSLGSVPTYVHAAVVAAVPTGPDKLSLGFESGFEFDLDPIYGGLTYTLRDIWLDDDDEVYPWDGEFGVQVGMYW
jgi:hypothetical protein